MASFQVKNTPPLLTQLIALETPRHFLLNGLLIGPCRPKTIFIYIHGLSNSLFSQKELTTSLVTATSAVLVFDNRGHNIISRVRRLNSRLVKGYQSSLMGAAHEIFVDCVDDIDGAVSFARRQGAQQIFLIGHSTGCQKSIYYLAQRPRSLVKGAILMAPMSDFADVKTNSVAYQKALRLARKLVKTGRKHDLMPSSVWSNLVDAQRFLSLHTPESSEEIFSYASKRQPKILQKTNKPLLVLLAEEDQFRDRPITEIAAWFKAALNKKKAQVRIIKGVGHNFFPQYRAVKKLIQDWTKKIN